MAKDHRLPERPKPPTFEELAEDIQSADDSDVVFTIGKNYLDAFENVEVGDSASDNGLSTSLNSSTSSVSPELVKESYAKVLRLLTIYSELKNAPSELEEKYKKLKDLRSEMTKSIEELKALSLELGSSPSSTKKAKSSNEQAAESKGKTKSKKKK